MNIDIENIDPKEVEQKTLLQNKNLSTTTPSTCNRPLHANALREILLIFTERVTGLWPRLWPRRTIIDKARKHQGYVNIKIAGS